MDEQVGRRNRLGCFPAGLAEEAKASERRERGDAFVGHASARHIEDHVDALAVVGLNDCRRHVLGAGIDGDVRAKFHGERALLR